MEDCIAFMLLPCIWWQKATLQWRRFCARLRDIRLPKDSLWDPPTYCYSCASAAHCALNFCSCSVQLAAFLVRISSACVNGCFEVSFTEC